MTIYSLNTLPQHIKDTPLYQERLEEADEDELDTLSYDDKLIPINYLGYKDPKFLSRALKIINYWYTTNKLINYPLIMYQYLDENREIFDDIRMMLNRKIKEHPNESEHCKHFLEYIEIDHDNILRWGCIMGAYYAIEYGFIIKNELEPRALECLCIGGFLNCLQLIFSKVNKEEISFRWCAIGTAIGGHYDMMVYLYDEYNKLSDEFKEENELWDVETTKYAAIATGSSDPECKIFKFIIEHDNDYWHPIIFRQIVRKINVECLKYILDKKLKMPNTATNFISRTANKDMLVLLYEHNFEFTSLCLS